jgi:hypothetical protein
VQHIDLPPDAPYEEVMPAWFQPIVTTYDLRPDEMVDGAVQYACDWVAGEAYRPLATGYCRMKISTDICFLF